MLDFTVTKMKYRDEIKFAFFFFFSHKEVPFTFSRLLNLLISGDY